MRWRRDDRPAPDDRRDQADDADNWLSEFRGQSVRPDALTAADRDAGGRQAAQVGSRPRAGEHPDFQPGRDERRSRLSDGQRREDDGGDRQPAPRPGPARADLERDFGPWSGVQRGADPDGDGRDRQPARRRDPAGWPGTAEGGPRRDRPSADAHDTDQLGKLGRADRPPPDGRRGEPYSAEPGSSGGDRRAVGAARPDPARRPPGPDGLRPDDGRGAFPAPDRRRAGPDPHAYHGTDGYRPGGPNRPGRDDGRARVPPGNGFDGLARSPAPLSQGVRPAETAPRRELPAARPDAARPARPPQPGSLPPGELRPDQHRRPAGPPGGRDSSARPDADRRRAQGLWPDEPPAPVHRPGTRRDEQGGRRDGSSWLAAPDRVHQPAPGFPENRALPAAADRVLPPAAGPALPAGRPRPAAPERRALPAPPPDAARPEAGLPEPVRPPETGSAVPSAGGRPELGANLSLADLERVRQALALLSEDSTAGGSGPAESGMSPVPTAARDDDPVPSFAGASLPAVLPPDADEDGADTTPLPVFLPGATAVPRPAHLDTPRGPFEPAHVELLQGVAVPAPLDTLVAPYEAAAPALNAAAAPAVAEPDEPAETLPRAAAQKLDEIKDLLITAEAIGEANLDRHFDRVSQRQRELIREFFEKANPRGEPEA